MAASDEDRLECARQLGRAVVSADEGFFRLVYLRRERGLRFPALIFVPSGTAVGVAVRGLEIASSVFEPVDMVAPLEWAC